jgi:hypothetical protein
MNKQSTTLLFARGPLEKMLRVQDFYSFSVGFFCPYTYFPPLSAEQTAATTHIIAPMMNASLSAVMNGAEIAFGKKVDPVR